MHRRDHGVSDSTVTVGVFLIVVTILCSIGSIATGLDTPPHADHGEQTENPARFPTSDSRRLKLPVAADRIDLKSYLEYVEDRTGNLTFSDIHGKSFQYRFEPLGDRRGFGYAASSFWFRLLLENPHQEPVEWILEYPYAPIDHIAFYVPVLSEAGDVVFKGYVGGDTHPFSHRPIPHKAMAVPVTISHGTHFVYVNIRSQGALPVQLAGWDIHAFKHHAQIDVNFNWFYYGCMVTISLFCLILFSSMKMEIYLYLFIFVGSATLCSMAHSGMASRYLLPNHPYWVNLLHPLSGYVASLGYLLYGRSFLNIPHHFPLLNRYINGLVVLLSALSLFVAWIPYRAATQIMLLSVGFVATLLSISSLVLLRKKVRGAGIFALSWSPFLIGVLLIIVKSYGYLPNNIFTDSLLQLSSSTTSILLCYGIIDKIDQFRTDRENAIDKMHTAVRMYTLLAENITDVIWILELKTMELIYVTPSVEAMTGYTPSEAGNFSFKKMLTPDSAKKAMASIEEGIRKYTEGIDKSPENVMTEVAFHHKNGETIWTETSMTFTQDESSKSLHMIGVSRDVTERKRAAEERRRLENKLHQAAKIEALATLSGGIAHDMNNILTSVLGYAQLSLDEAEQESRMHKRLSRIIEACYRAKDLVSQVLTFSRQDSAEDQIILIHLIVKEALKLIRSSFPSAIAIDVDIRDKSLRININPTQLHRIVMNLCTNAAHAMQKDGGRLRVTIDKMVRQEKDADELYSLDPGEYVRLTISDTGHGMDETVVKRIFEPFFTTKPAGVGTGMGLSMVHGIVHKAGGDIFVESKPGKGTTFHLLFPSIEKKND